MGNERVSITLGKPAIRFGRSNTAGDNPHAPHRSWQAFIERASGLAPHPEKVYDWV